MKRTTLSNHLGAFRSESLTLLRFQLAFDRMIKFKDYSTLDRSEFVDKIIALKAIENDILIRVCKFDDDTIGVHSFNNALQEIPETHVNKEFIHKKIGIFKTAIKKVKRNRRHTQLAHLKIGSSDNEFEPKYDFRPAINLITEIIDLLNITPINYQWSDGRYEKYDLREEVLVKPTIKK